MKENGLNIRNIMDNKYFDAIEVSRKAELYVKWMLFKIDCKNVGLLLAIKRVFKYE